MYLATAIASIVKLIGLLAKDFYDLGIFNFSLPTSGGGGGGGRDGGVLIPSELYESVPG